MPTLWLPDAPPAVAGSQDDEFNDSLVAGAWTERDFTTNLVVTEDKRGLVLQQFGMFQDQAAGITKNVQSGDWTYWTKVSLSKDLDDSYTLGGLALWQNAAAGAGDIILLNLFDDGGGVYVTVLEFRSYEDWWDDFAFQSLATDVTPDHLYLRVRRTGTTYSFEFSTDGKGWQLLYSGTIPFVPLHIGPFINNSSGLDSVAVFDFFRYIASDVGLMAAAEGRRVEVAVTS